MYESLPTLLCPVPQSCIGVMQFVNNVLTVVCQLKSINGKPTKDQITDKLLIGLHSSFTAVHTNIFLHTPEPSIKEITATLKEFKDNETLLWISDISQYFSIFLFYLFTK